MPEKTNNKQKNKKIVLALVWNLPVRRLFGGRLGICDFRHKTAKAVPGISDLALRGVDSTSRRPRGPGFSGLNKGRP